MRRYNDVHMQYKPHEVQGIPLSRIDFGDGKYQTRLPWNLTSESLQKLIAAAGIVTPLRLEVRDSGDFRIISGFRRLQIARELGLPDIPALVIQGEPDRLFLSAVCENMSQNPDLDLSERAGVAVRMLREFEYGEDRVASEILPLLRLPATLHQLRQLRFLARMPETIQHAISGRLTLQSARIIGEWDDEDAEFFIGVVNRYQLGTNKQKQLLSLLEDLRRREGCSVRKLWESSGAAAIERREELAPTDRFRAFRGLLRQQRFPVLSQYEERAEALEHALSLPAKIKLLLPPYFEGDHIDIHLRVSSPSELRSLVGVLESASSRDEMEKLFDLL